MQVIGVVGRSGCGKDALADYLRENYGLAVFSIGRLVRELTENRHMRPTRANLHHVSAEILEKKGPEYLAQAITEAVARSGCEKALIVGIRTPEDVRILRGRYPHFLLVAVTIGDQRARFARVSERATERDPDSFDAFLEQDMAEEELFRIGETLALADLTIRNVGTSAQLEDEVDLRIASRMGLAQASRQET